LSSVMREIAVGIIASVITVVLTAIATYFYSLNPMLAIILPIIVGLISVLYYYIRRYYSVCKVLGIKCLSDKKKEPWDKYFANSKNIRVLFGRGGAVLGTDTDPMYLTLKRLGRDWEGRVRVLVEDPESEHLTDRAKELGLDIETVKNQCRMVMNNVKRLREDYHINIEGAYYNTKPFLRFTLFDDFGFFSYPAWGDKYEPFPYQFRIKRGKKTMYDALSVYFEHMWNTYGTNTREGPIDGKKMG